ncbi:MAG: uL13 family ribosomal protein [Thermoplasmata archaeon]
MVDLVIDATGLVLGRLASYVAKELLNGKEVAILNAEKFKGRDAYRRVKAYIGVPKAFENAKLLEIPKAKARPGAKGVTVGEIARYLGADF